MFTVASKSGNFWLIGKEQLLKLKLKALRSGVWFNALSRIDRVLVDLTIKVTRSIRSRTLAKSIFAIVQKLQNILDGDLSSRLIEIGLPLAQKISALAQRWGNKNAQEWANNIGFVRYLAIMALSGNRQNRNVKKTLGTSAK